MAKITKNCLSLDYDRKCELIKRAKVVKSHLDYHYKSKGLYNDFGLNFKLEKAYCLYKSVFNLG